MEKENRRTPVHTLTSTPSTNNQQNGVRLDPGSIRDWQVYGLIILAASIIYTKSVFYQYTYFDDVPLVVLNQSFLTNLSNLPKLFSTDVFISTNNPEVFYRPLLNLLFMLELQVSKDSPVIFHITNILLHIGCSLLLFVIFKQLKVSRAIAGAAALLFCVHPLNTSAVAWIPGRNDLLLTLLVLSSFSMLLRALDIKRLTPLILHLLLFFLAMLTKESAIALPFLSAGYVLWVRQERVRLKTEIAVGAGYLLLLALWFLMRSTVTQTAGFHLSPGPLALGWIMNTPALILYVGKAILPFNLSVMPNLNDQSLWLGFISIAALVAAFIVRRPPSFRGIIWGLAWFFLFLAPTLLSATIFHEHRTYSAFFGFLFAVTQLPLVQSIDFSRGSRILGFVAILALFAVIAMWHSEHFHNREAYAMNAYMKDPSVDAAQAALADLFLDEGHNTEAERVLIRAIAQDSSMRFVHRLLGDVYANRHEYAAAAREYETAIRIDKLELYAYIGYGKICIDVGQPDKALSFWKRTVDLSPNFLVGYQYLATFYTYVRSNPDSAMYYVREVQQRGGSVVPELLHAIQAKLKSKSKDD